MALLGAVPIRIEPSRFRTVDLVVFGHQTSDGQCVIVILRPNVSNNGFDVD